MLNHGFNAITSHPLLLHAVGKQIQHARSKIIQVWSNHPIFKKIELALSNLSYFFKGLKSRAEQLNVTELIKHILCRAFKKFMTPTVKIPPELLPQPW